MTVNEIRNIVKHYRKTLLELTEISERTSLEFIQSFGFNPKTKTCKKSKRFNGTSDRIEGVIRHAAISYVESFPEILNVHTHPPFGPLTSLPSAADLDCAYRYHEAIIDVESKTLVYYKPHMNNRNIIDMYDFLINRLCLEDNNVKTLLQNILMSSCDYFLYDLEEDSFHTGWSFGNADSSHLDSLVSDSDNIHIMFHVIDDSLSETTSVSVNGKWCSVDIFDIYRYINRNVIVTVDYEDTSEF